jgi:hypothetical protein
MVRLSVSKVCPGLKSSNCRPLDFIVAVPYFDDAFYPADLSIAQPHFDAVRMVARGGQYILNDAAGQATGALILLEDDVDVQPGSDIRAVFTIHDVIGLFKVLQNVFYT